MRAMQGRAPTMQNVHSRTNPIRGRAALLVLLVSCGPAAPFGGAELRVHRAALGGAPLARVTLSVTGAGIAAPLVTDLSWDGSAYRGRMAQIPAGTNRTFAAEGFDAQGARLYAGQLGGVTIVADATVTVALVLQQTTPPPPFENSAPVIDGLLASASGVVPGGSVGLAVTAHDPDPADTLSYAWSATAGSFDQPGSSRPVYTAPATEGPVTLTVQVSDGRGGVSALDLSLSVGASFARGGAEVRVSLNTWPVVSAISPRPSRVEPGGSTAITLFVSDADGDALSFLWTDSGCGGAFDSAALRNPNWTAPLVAPAVRTCRLEVTVDDGRGGTGRAAVVVAVGGPAGVNVAPRFTSVYQSRELVAPGDTVRLLGEAVDPEGQGVTFAWSASGGTLEVPVETTGRSEVRWRAPTQGCQHAITLEARDPAGGASRHVFGVTSCGP
ncbi:MAG: hypothetical protein IT371_12055 [Deltaproteobacteria bacterium]|nr:hypothetical protein [Deltaproteobacteria bacterium]